jgi:hypothetical protein
MFLDLIVLGILYLVFKYIVSWIVYYNKIDSRLGSSVWRWSYDYPVVGKRDVSDLDDKFFVRLRRKRNNIISYMYIVSLLIFIALMSLLSNFLLFLFN